MTKLERRVIELSYKYRLSHVGSCMTAVGIIDDIYRDKMETDRFVLSSGHAGIALYAVLEGRYGIDADMLFEKHGVHPCRDVANRIWVSSGSLGCGLPIAVGMALADPEKHIYCLVSDGECAEGSIWESLRFADKADIDNLKIHVNINGWSAYDLVDRDKLERQLKSVCPSVTVHQTYYPGELGAHYHVLTEAEYAALVC